MFQYSEIIIITTTTCPFRITLLTYLLNHHFQSAQATFLPTSMTTTILNQEPSGGVCEYCVFHTGSLILF